MALKKVKEIKKNNNNIDYADSLWDHLLWLEIDFTSIWNSRVHSISEKKYIVMEPPF